MPFTLLEVDFATDFSDVIECQWISYENPLQPFVRMFCPPLSGDGPAAHAQSLEASAAVQLDCHRSGPVSHGRKAVDENGKIVGACLWKIYKTNSFEKPDDHAGAEWYPEGETREYVSKCLKQFDAPRRSMAARPHVYLNTLFTHPDYRRRGVADMMLAWGKQRADKMGVEMWLDATAYGVPVYLKHGFLVVNESRPQPTKDGASEDWCTIDKELQPMTFWQMWRPVGGIYDEGKSVKPWVRAVH